MTTKELTALLDRIGAATDEAAVQAIVAELDAEALAAVQAELSDTIRVLATSVSNKESADPVKDMESVHASKEALTVVNARVAELDAEAQTHVDDAAAILAELEGGDGEGDSDGESDGDDDAGSDDDASDDGDDATEDDAAPASTDDVVEVPEAIAASAAPRRRPVALGKVAAERPRQIEPKTAPALTLVASAGLADSGVRAGSRFNDSKELGRAMAEAARGLTPGAKLMVATADFSDQIPYQITDDAEANFLMLDGIRRDAEAGTVITAAGGICAPGQPFYEFFSVSSRAGLLSLPPVNSTRGSMIHPVSPGVAALLAETGIAFPWDNATDLDPGETVKPVFTPACVETRTCTIEAYATRLGFGNFSQIFYPEFVAHLTSEAMITHDHKVDIALIADIVAMQTVNPDFGAGGDTGGGSWVNVTHILTWWAAWYRNKHRMDLEASLELLAPAYVRDALAVDYIARNGTVDMGRAYAAVDEWFRVANLRVQWLANLNPIDNPSNSFPAADFVLFAPGTIIRQTRASLNLGVVRDSTLNDTNDFQTFEETFDSACLIGNEVAYLQNVPVCPTGETGQLAAIACLQGITS